MKVIIDDVMLALRSLARQPALVVAAILCVALSIGASTAVFSVLNASLFAELPFPESDSLFLIWRQAQGSAQKQPASDADFLELRERPSAFQAVEAAQAGLDRALLSGRGEPESVTVALASSGYFRLLGHEPQVGRVFTRDEERRGSADVVVLSHGLWRRRFGSDSQVIGRTIFVAGRVREVIGVMAREFRDPVSEPQSEPDLWLPLQPDSSSSASARGWCYLLLLGRLRAGTDSKLALQEVRAAAARLEAVSPDTNRGVTFSLESLRDGVVGGVRRTLLVLMAAAGMLLFIACANVASLLLARGVGRHRDIAVRAALGAPPFALVKQFFFESAAVGAVGGVAGVLIALASRDFIVALCSGSLLFPDRVDLDWRVLLFACALSLGSSLLFGVLPAVQGIRVDLLRSLQAGGAVVSADRTHRRFGAALVALEVTLAVAVTVPALALIESFYHLRSVEPGFKSQGLFSLSLVLPENGYSDEGAASQFFQALLEQVRASRVVEAATLSRSAPFGGEQNCFGFTFVGDTTDGRENLCSELQDVTPEYFSTLKIPVIAGQIPEPVDNLEAVKEVAINQSMAKRLFGSGDAIGRRIGYNFNGARYVVAAVVGDTRTGTLSAAPGMQAYRTFARGAGRRLHLVVRARAHAESLVAELKRTLVSLDPSLAFISSDSVDSLIERSGALSSSRFRAIILAFFSGASVLLAAIGIFGIMAHAVSARAREFGIRMALGATSENVVKQVMLEGVQPVLMGLGGGCLASVGIMRLVSELLFKVGGRDLLTLIPVPLALGAVGAGACWLAARRAVGCNSVMEVLRED